MTEYCIENIFKTKPSCIQIGNKTLELVYVGNKKEHIGIKTFDICDAYDLTDPEMKIYSLADSCLAPSIIGNEVVLPHMIPLKDCFAVFSLLLAHEKQLLEQSLTDEQKEKK